MNFHPPAAALIIVFFIAVKPAAQAQLDLSKWQVGLNGGMMIYQGDLTPTDIGSYKTTRPTLSFYISRILNPSILLRTNIAFGKLYGNDAKYSTPVWRQQRNLKFTTPVTEISEQVVWNMLGNNGNEMGHRFSPYAFAGLGISFLNVNRDTSKFNTHYFASLTNVTTGLRADMGRSTPGAVLVVPVGLGMEFYLTPRLSLTAETSFRYTFTDYLDGFSLGANPSKKDFYYSHTVGLLYRFGKRSKLDCPVMKR